MRREINISRDIVCACINADDSGLSESDITALNEFMSHFNTFHVLCPDDVETDFRYCEVTGLMSDCLLVQVKVA